VSDTAMTVIAWAVLVSIPLVSIVVDDLEYKQAKRRRRAFELGFEEGQSELLHRRRKHQRSCITCSACKHVQGPTLCP
jgi:hypothetical protein